MARALCETWDSTNAESAGFPRHPKKPVIPTEAKRSERSGGTLCFEDA
jgi:hypothetical protein